ncbi:hypothetical protein [Actinotalea sp. Marseille-Q4924]|uniref:hypothetical protein n=1 Tax=Actinotalea sp. Marseille-Q4924 TaxID=2866571 RepID=UPI001CE45615|nr:hypothetical protein [Actinotalea sp. Marseille-Q4924]
MHQGRRGTAGVRRAPARLVVAWLALLAGVATLAAQAPVLVHRCLPADGLTGALGIRLALLRPDVDCPSGTLAVGAEPGQAMGLLVLVTVPVVVAHALSLLAAACVVAGAGLLLRAVGALSGAVVPTVPGVPRVVVDRARAVVASVVSRVVRPVLDTAVLRRGPPALVGA